MISTELANLADWIIAWGAKGQAMPPQNAAHLADVLLALADQVKHMERMSLAVDAFIYADKEDADSVL
jgi:hypothetical protein